MPSLILTNSVSKAHNLKRLQLVVDDPVTAISEAIWDDVTSNANAAYVGSGTSYMSVSSTSAGGYAARVFKVIPKSEYKITAVMTAVLGGGDATLEVGIEAGDESLVDENIDSGGGTAIATFNAGNRKTIWVTLVTNSTSSAAYWDSIKIEETG